MELAHSGFGSPGVLMKERVDIILDAYDYLKYRVKYENQRYLLGRDK